MSDPHEKPVSPIADPEGMSAHADAVGVPEQQPKAASKGGVGVYERPASAGTNRLLPILAIAVAVVLVLIILFFVFFN